MLRESPVIAAANQDELLDLQRRVATWRRTRRLRTRMPEALWNKAAVLARSHGVNPIARALRLDYYSLKRRVCGPEEQQVQQFVEFTLESTKSSSSQSSLCTVEMQRPDGGRMRVAAATPAALAVLCEAFWAVRGR
jgi:hypothetical protein